MHRPIGDIRAVAARARAPRVQPPREPAIDFAPLARRWQSAATPDFARSFADELGVNVLALRRLGLGWASPADVRCAGTPLRGDDGCWTFPMGDAELAAGDGRIVGVRCRTWAGDKFSLRGSDGSALFVPRAPRLPRGGDLWLPEGPTSAAALLSLGLSAVGRPNNLAGGQHLARLVALLRPARVLVVGDNDRKADGRWPGLEGARSIARQLAGRCPAVQVVMPPDHVGEKRIKDVRDWLAAGADASDVQSLAGERPAGREAYAS